MKKLFRLELKKLTEVILMLSLTAALFGCTKSPAVTPLDPADFPAAHEKAAPELPGKLAGVRHESSAGSMEFASEFAIELTPEEIVHCEYWDLDKDRSHMLSRDRVAIMDSQWADVEKAVLDLWGVWEEIPEEVLNKKPDPNVQILDGGDYNRWWLTWEKADGSRETVRYYYPGDRRIVTLKDLLEELANPKGREIVWYEPPSLCGATYINDKTDMSFQCNWWEPSKGSAEGYRFIVRFKEDGQKVNIYDQAKPSVWEAAKPAFAWLDPEQYDYGSYKDPITLSLYYSDGSQKSLKLDKETAQTIEPYLRKLTLEYLEQK